MGPVCVFLVRSVIQGPELSKPSRKFVEPGYFVFGV